MFNTILLIAILLVGLFIAYKFFAGQKDESKIDSIKSDLTNQFFNFTRQLDERLSYHLKVQSGNEDKIKSTLEEANKSYKEVETKLTNLFEMSRRIYDVGKDVSKLNEILSSPKLRGGLGEFMLEDLLKQVIPLENYQLQYAFKSGEKVDAIIKLSDEKFVCVDSKFPYENFNKYISETDSVEKAKFKSVLMRDIKKHIDAIALKYIKPTENTFDFALMYIPAENIYYEMIMSNQEDGLIAYCYEKKVIPVSPNNFFVYLQTVLMGLKGFQIEQNAKKIYNSLSHLSNLLKNFSGEFSTLGGHLTNAKNKFDQTERGLIKLTDGVEGIIGQEGVYLDERTES